MGSLGQLGVTGMLAVNSWMSTISANINGASRTAYKPTRVSLLDGAVNSFGDFQIPQPTMQVQATTLEWAQGSIRQSDSSAHFALQGQGFFVLVDDAGDYYLTRDGEFHWDGLGFLRNSNGLRVVSNGQDFVRRGPQDEDIFSQDGESAELARYGDKSFLIVDVANRDGLKFSRYGATVFEVDGELPLRVENNFDTSTDGLTFLYRDPKQLPYVGNHDTPAFVPFNAARPNDSNFTIDLGENGTFDYSAPVPFGTGAPFDPDTETIQDVIDAINSYGTANNANIFASYDPATDRFLIRNIGAPKVNDPGFRPGNFQIDLGDNGIFQYPNFDTKRTTIRQIVDEINRYAAANGVNVVASFDDVNREFSLVNTTGAIGDNQIVFQGGNGAAIADFFNLPAVTASSGGGAQNADSASNIDNNPPSANTFAQITPVDVNSTPLGRLVNPDTSINFGGGNGRPLADFFRVYNVASQADGLAGNSGSRLESRRDIDNSMIRSDLDIQAADIAALRFSDYVDDVPSAGIGLASGPPPTYTHDKLNNVVISDSGPGNALGLLGISHAQQTRDFDLVFDYSTDATALDLHFAQQRNEQIDSGGYTLKYIPLSGDVFLYARGDNPDDAPALIGTGTLPTSSGLGTRHRFAARLDEDGNLEASVDGVSTAFTLNLDEVSSGGYLTLGHVAGRLELFNMYADYKATYSHDATGGMVSTGIKSYANREVSAPSEVRGNTRVLQSSLESSTASLTEYIPMLGLAQKVFASLSKIINVSNALQDDINQLIR